MKTFRMWVFVVSCFFITSMGLADVTEKPVTVEGIQAQLLELPWSYEDRKTETPEARKARAKDMAQGLFNAGEKMPAKFNRRPLIAAAIAIWWFETRFSLEVHSGGRSKYGSDDGKAKCFGQHHERAVGLKMEPEESVEQFRVRQREMWESLAGTSVEATERCALATMRQFAGKLSQCRTHENRVAAAFGSYGSGGECALLPTSIQRAELMSRLAPRL